MTKTTATITIDGEGENYNAKIEFDPPLPKGALDKNWDSLPYTHRVAIALSKKIIELSDVIDIKAYK